jgi:hypothetical protein
MIGPMRTMSASILAVLLGACAASGPGSTTPTTGTTGALANAAPDAAPPEFPSLDGSRWLNGAPASLASLRGNVVLVESWHRL